jgi:hypothetical protein
MSGANVGFIRAGEHRCWIDIRAMAAEKTMVQESETLVSQIL